MQKLWVAHETPERTYRPTKVTIDECEYVDDLKVAIRNNPVLAIPQNTAITLYQPDGTTEIDVGDSPFDYLTGNSRRNPLVVKSTAPSTLTMVQPAGLFSPCQIDFYNNIFNATEADGWISFEEVIPSSTLKRLFVRESYISIASNIQPGLNKTIISGTPGIGKSLFLIYLLWKLVKDRKRVLFIYHPDTIYYDGQDGVFELTGLPSVVDHSFWASDLWCLFDAKGKKESHLSAFPYGRCTFILSTFPQRELVNDFKKPPVPEEFYMPTWTQSEMEAIAPLFPNVIEWRDRFRVLGGIPRHVLEVTKNPPTELLIAACTECSLDDCIKNIGENSTITERSMILHLLLHIKSTSPYRNSSVCCASQTALNIIVQKKGSEARFRMRELLHSCEGNPLTASLCGYVFESYAIELLEKGGSFVCRKLVHGNTKTIPRPTKLKIPTSRKIAAEKVLADQICNQLYVPTTSNYTAIDAWIPGIGAFQMTVAKNHDIKGGAIDDLAMLGKGANKLYWLLPPLYYDTFTKKTPQDIDQYAVQIPYPTL